MPSRLSKNLNFIFKKSNIYEVTGDQVSSLNILTKAQKNHTGDRRILFKIADLYANDKQIARAYAFFISAEIKFPIYGAVRRLSFEVNHLMIDNAKETLEKILKYKSSDLVRYISMLNRVSAYFPEYSNQIVKARNITLREINKNIFKDNKTFNKKIEYLLSRREIKNISQLFETAEEHNLEISDKIIHWFDKINDFISIDDDLSFVGWIEAAHRNESSENLIGLKNGMPLEIKEKDINNDNIIELFIPNSIFTNPAEDKSSFETVNILFKTLFKYLLKKEDLIIIPRHQYNWRYCLPRTEGKIISYHTYNNINNNRNWLHIQESTFSGYCSIDSKGFAGYSSIATDFQMIDLKTNSIDTEELEVNQQYLYNKYIENNISKYEQADITFKCDGKYVFVALQVLTDVVADLAYINGINLVKTVANHYKDSNCKVIVKRHPFCNSMTIQTTLTKLEDEGLIEISNASIHDIIKDSEVVFTVNSGVGLESLIHLKPVVVTGDCDYLYGVHSKVKTEEELISIMEKNNFDIDKDRILKLLYFYNKFYIQNEDTINGTIEKWLK